MLEQISGFFWNLAGPRSFIIGMVIYVVFGAFIMPAGMRAIQEKSSKPIKIIDLQFSYSPEQVRQIIGDYSDESKKLAIRFNLVADSLYPLSYTFLFLMMMGWLFKSLARYGFRIRHVHMLPLLVMIADYSENIGVATMFSSYPDFSDGLAVFTSACTTFKWSMLVVEAFIIGGGIWLLTFYTITRSRKKH